MLQWRSVVAMAVAVARVVLCVSQASAQAGAAALPTFLFSAGSDLWRDGSFLYGGALWAPAGLDRDGFALKTLLSGGRYSYEAGDLATTVDGTLMSAAALPGWRFNRDGISVSVFAGAVLQNYRLKPYDPGSRLHGFYSGGEITTELWSQPTAHSMAAASATFASIGPSGAVRAGTGIRVFDAGFAGPEAAATWCGNFRQLQFGLHLTAFRFGGLEWSGGAGWSTTSDRRDGPYLRLGVSARY